MFVSFTLAWKKNIPNLILESHFVDSFISYLKIWFLPHKHPISFSPKVAQTAHCKWWEQKLPVTHKPYILLKLETRLEV